MSGFYPRLPSAASTGSNLGSSASAGYPSQSIELDDITAQQVVSGPPSQASRPPSLQSHPSSLGFFRDRAEKQLRHRRHSTHSRTPIQDIRDGDVASAAINLYSVDGLQAVRQERHLLTSKNLRIDYVLVYNLPKRAAESETYERDLLEQCIHSEEGGELSAARKRLQFERHLTQQGLILEKELGVSGHTCYVKIHAPFDVLLEQAQLSRVRKPLKDQNLSHDATDANEPLPVFFSWFENVAKFLHRLGRKPKPKLYTAPFIVSQRQAYQDSDSVDKFFTTAERSLLVWDILLRTYYKKNKKSIKRLLANESYVAAFPLHDSRCVPDSIKEEVGIRTGLYRDWGRFRVFYKPQPIQDIKSYFGDKIALYFAFLGFYSKALIFPAIIGFLAFLYGLGAYKDRPDSDQVCSSAFVLCPLCDTCETLQLKDACNPYEVSYIFDNEASIVFGFLLAVWASVFIDFWKRKNAKLAYEWDLTDFEETEPNRAQYQPRYAFKTDKVTGDKVKFYPKKPDRITGKPVKYYPSWLRKLKYLGSFSALLLMVALVMAVLVATIVYRAAVRIALLDPSGTQVTRERASLITDFTAAVLNLLGIVVLNFAYRFVAILLNNWENHKTESKHEYHLTLKIFLFQFVNSYASLFYIAFFKGRNVGVPGNYRTFAGYRTDQCPPYGCMLELTTQLFVIMIGKQTLNNFVEIFLPRIMARVHRLWHRAKERHQDYLPWEEEYLYLAEYEDPPFGIFEDYLELIIQFGFISLFVSALPLAPLFALINNVLEIRVDSSKLLTSYRRPTALRAESIGLWQRALSFVSFVSVITNGLVLAYTSEFITRFVYNDNNNGFSGYIETTFPVSPVAGEDCRYRGLRDAQGARTRFFFEVAAARLAFFIIFEHLVFALKIVVQALIPDVPKYIRTLQLRERYLADLKLHGLEPIPSDEDSGDDEEDDHDVRWLPQTRQGLRRNVSLV